MKTVENKLTEFTKASFRQRRKHLFPLQMLKASNHRHSWWQILAREVNMFGSLEGGSVRNIKKI
jgi:hypothetical protein